MVQVTQCIQKPYHLLPYLNPDGGFTFLVPTYQVVQEKRPLNGCSMRVTNEFLAGIIRSHYT